jgi:hypothetical protein
MNNEIITPTTGRHERRHAVNYVSLARSAFNVVSTYVELLVRRTSSSAQLTPPTQVRKRSIRDARAGGTRQGFRR